jgi:integrase/recombinase XerC
MDSHLPAPSSADATATAAAVVGAFLNGRNERTLRAYRQDLNDFCAFVGATAVEQAAAGLLGSGQGAANALALAYKAHLRERGLQAATVNRRLAALRAFVKLARMLGSVSWSLDVENVRTEPYRDTRGPGRDGIRRLFATLEAGRADPRSLRDRAALRLMYHLGLRRGEVVALNVGDIDLGRGTIAVRGKGRSDKELLSLTGPVTAALGDWLRARGETAAVDAPLFVRLDAGGKSRGRLSTTGLYKMVQARGRQAGLAPLRPHGLRHTAITDACRAAQQNGRGLEEVMRFSRHKDIKVLLVYRDQDENAQAQIAEMLSDL